MGLESSKIFATTINYTATLRCRRIINNNLLRLPPKPAILFYSCLIRSRHSLLLPRFWQFIWFHFRERSLMQMISLLSVTLDRMRQSACYDSSKWRIKVLFLLAEHLLLAIVNLFNVSFILNRNNVLILSHFTVNKDNVRSMRKLETETKYDKIKHTTRTLFML